MPKLAGMLAVALFAVCVAGCGAAGDEPARKWTEFIRKHEASVRDGSFDAEGFKSEGRPLARELAGHKRSDGTVRLTEDVLKDLEKAYEDFAAACTEHGNLGAFLAYQEVAGEFDDTD